MGSLVAPWATDSSDYSEQARRLQAEFDATGHLGRHGHRPARATVVGTRKWALVMRAALLVLAVVSIGMVVQLAYVSRLEHRSAQVNLYNQFRTELALGTGPLGPRGIHHSTLALGAPMAQITIPSIGVSQVVLEGTTGNILADGPGHVRSTVFPGGTGDSIILGRAAAYGGPFGQISHLRKGAKITVVTQVGTSVFRVIDVRPSGAKVIQVPGNSSVLTLGTASGTPFAPSGVVYVDALKVGAALAAQKPTGQDGAGQRAAPGVRHRRPVGPVPVGARAGRPGRRGHLDLATAGPRPGLDRLHRPDAAGLDVRGRPVRPAPAQPVVNHPTDHRLRN